MLTHSFPTVAALALLLTGLTACGDKSKDSDKPKDSDKSKTTESSAKSSASASSAGATGPAEFKEYNAGADLLKIPSKGGEPCPGAGMRLVSKSKMISCAEGKPAQEHECKGPKGVTLDKDGLIPSCDISKNAAGDLCNILIADSACDGKKSITCDLDIEKADVPSKVVIKTCSGPKGCYMEKEGEIETAQCDEGDH